MASPVFSSKKFRMDDQSRGVRSRLTFGFGFGREIDGAGDVGRGLTGSGVAGSRASVLGAANGWAGIGGVASASKSAGSGATATLRGRCFLRFCFEGSCEALLVVGVALSRLSRSRPSIRFFGGAGRRATAPGLGAVSVGPLIPKTQDSGRSAGPPSFPRQLAPLPR